MPMNEDNENKLDEATFNEMVEGSRDDLPTESKAFYNKIQNIGETDFNWTHVIQPKTEKDYDGLPEEVRLAYIMWFVSTVAINNGIRWQDACNNVVLRLSENQIEIDDDKPKMVDAEEFFKLVSDRLTFMLNIKRILMDSGFDPYGSFAFNQLNDMGIMKRLSIEDSAKLEFLDDKRLIAKAKEIFKKIIPMLAPDERTAKSLLFVLASSFKNSDDEDNMAQEAFFAILKSKNSDLDGPASYDSLIDMGWKAIQNNSGLDDPEYCREFKSWLEAVEAN